MIIELFMFRFRFNEAEDELNAVVIMRKISNWWLLLLIDPLASVLRIAKSSSGRSGNGTATIRKNALSMTSYPISTLRLLEAPPKLPGQFGVPQWHFSIRSRLYQNVSSSPSKISCFALKTIRGFLETNHSWATRFGWQEWLIYLDSFPPFLPSMYPLEYFKS